MRPPIRPAGKPHAATSYTSSREPPCRSQRTVETRIAASTANTYAKPYACTNSGPTSTPFEEGLGISPRIIWPEILAAALGVLVERLLDRRPRGGRARAAPRHARRS